MTTKALITRRASAAPERLRAAESAVALDSSLDVEQVLPNATLVRGEAAELQALEGKGFRVKLLADTEIPHINGHRIDTTAPPKAAAGLEVPEAEAKDWSHHLVQRVAPPSAEWVAEIEALGVDVVEPVSAYGLFVVAPPARLQTRSILPFVAWVGAFKPAWRIASNLHGAKGMLHWLSVGVYPHEAGAAVADLIGSLGGQVLDSLSQPAPCGGAFAVLR